MIKPSKNHILIELEPTPSKQGKIHIPQALEKGRIKPVAAKVLATGENVELFEGDRILVPCYGGFHVDETKRIFKQEEVIGILTKSAEIGV